MDSRVVYGDAYIHQPTGLIVDGIELVDEDGVVCSDTRIHFLGHVAQNGGFAFDNLYRVALLLPRQFGPVDSVEEKFGDVREFRLVKNDKELGNLIRGWSHPKYAKIRIKHQRAQALSRIYSTLQYKIRMRQKTLANLAHEELTLEEDPWEDYGDIEYNETIAVHGIWELALNRTNQKAILNGENDIITSLTFLVKREARSFDSDMVTSLVGSLWALSLQTASQHRLVALNLVNMLFSILREQNSLHLRRPPRAQVYSLGVLRVLLEATENRRFFVEQSISREEMDPMRFLAATMPNVCDRDVWDHIMAIILRAILRDKESLDTFLDEYPQVGGDPVKIVFYFCHLLKDVTARASSRSTGLKGSNNSFMRDDANTVQMDTGARLAISLLLSKLATRSRKGRSVLLRHSNMSTNNTILSLLRWSIHSMPCEVAARECRSSIQSTGGVDMDDGIGMTVCEESRIVDFATCFDSMEAMLSPRKLSVSKYHHQPKEMEQSSDLLDENLNDAEELMLGPRRAKKVRERPARNTIPRCPDVESDDVVHFDQDQWGLSSGRAHDISLLHSAMGLWGVAKALSEMRMNTNDTADAATGSRSSVSMAAPMTDTQTFLDQSVNEICLCQDLSDEYLASLLSLGLVSRQAVEPKLKVELCTLSAFNALAHASSPAIRRRVLRLDHLSLIDDSESSLSPDHERLKSFPDPDYVVAERQTELGSNYSKALTELLIGKNKIDFEHPVYDAKIGTGTSTTTLTLQGYAMSTLCGFLETIMQLGLSASVALPYLDIKDVLSDCTQSAEVENSHEALINRCLCSAAVMLHSLHPKVDVSEEDGEDPYPQWSPEACKLLLESVKGRTDASAPTGANLMYLSLAVWSLCRYHPLRMICLRQGFIDPLIERANHAMDMLEVYYKANKDLSKNALELLKLERETKAVLRKTTFSSNTPKPVQDRQRILESAGEHMNSLNSCLVALWGLVMNHDLFAKTRTSDSVVPALAINLSTKDEDRKLIKKSRKALFQLVLRVMRAGSIGQKGASLTYVYGAHKDLVDTATGRAVSILWTMASLRISDRLLCSKDVVQGFLDLAYNSNISAENRCLVARMLTYFDRLLPKSETSTTVRRTLERMISDTYLCEVVLHFLGSQDEQLQGCGAEMLGKVRSTRVGQALVRNHGGIELLLNLTGPGICESVVCSALKGLRHVSLDTTSQEYLCSKGLYQLLQLSWTTHNTEHRRIIAQILKQLSENAKNKTLIYKAELRARHMLGWKGTDEPDPKQVVAFNEELRLMEKQKQKNMRIGPERTRDGKDKNSLHFKGANGAVKNNYLEWIDSLRVEEANREAALSSYRTSSTKVSRISHRGKKKKKSKDTPPTDESAAVPQQADAATGAAVSTEEEEIRAFDVDEEDDDDAAGNSEEGKKLTRTLSSFLRDVRMESMQHDASNTLGKNGGRNGGRSTALEVVIPNITAPDAKFSPKKPTAPSSPTKKLSPRSPRFKSKSPVESPLWELRDQIHHIGKQDITVAAAECKNATASKPVRHSKHSPFSVAQHQNANVELSKRMRQPVRSMWAPDSLYTNVGKDRWAPKVRDITTTSPRQLDEEKAFIKFGTPDAALINNSKRKKNTRGTSSGGKGSGESDTHTTKEEGNDGEDNEVDGDVAGGTEKETVKYCSQRIDQINVKMESSRPYSMFVFNRGGDPYAALRAIDFAGDEDGDDSDTSISSDECYSEDDEEVEEESKQGADANERPTATTRRSPRTAEHKREKLLRKKRRELRRKSARERHRRIQNLSTPKRVHLSKFVHVEGSKVYDDIPKYTLPNGQEIFLYLSGGPLFGRDKLEDVEAPPLCPTEIVQLNFPNGQVPTIPKLVSNAKHLYSSDFVPLPIAKLPAPKPSKFSLAQFGGRQPNTMVAWSPDGVVLDEPLPIKTAYRDEVDESEGDELVDEPWSLERSVWAARGKQQNGFYNDQTVRSLAFEKEWQLCEQKRTFRKLTGRYDAEDILELKEVLKECYGVVCNTFRHFSSMDQILSVYTLQMLEFCDFCEKAEIKETDPESLIQEGHCNTIFIQVSRNPIEEWTTKQQMFEEECGVLSLKKGTCLMRYQFLECLIRLAEAKYIKNRSYGLSSITTACRRLFRLVEERPLIKSICEYFDEFRRRQMYCERVDKELYENLTFLKELFSRFAGRSENAKSAGGSKGKRLTFDEWNSLLLTVGLYNPLFTLRESNLVFRGCSLDVADEIVNWRQVVSLNFPDFLEALCRTADMMVVPTPDQLEDVGADNIVEYYSIMEKTGLWTVMAEHADSHSESGDTKPGPIELNKRLKSLFALFNHIEERKAQEELEKKLWKQDPKGMLEQAEKARVDQLQSKADEIKLQKRTTKVGLNATIVRPKRTSKTGEEKCEEPVAQTTLQKAIAAVEEGVPMERFEAHVASTLHDVWREQRSQRGDGYEPRIKMVKGVQYDIANLCFADLPGYFQMENLLAAFDACQAIRRAFNACEVEKLPIVRFYVQVESDEFLEEASRHQHEQWVKRNAKKPWVEDHQKVSWDKLREEDKRKNKDIIQTAVKVWIAHNRV